jgi:hypothetical protein
MTYSAENTYNNLLDEVIAKARLKGANITGWTLSPNRKVVIHIPGKLPVYYLSLDAAVDSLIHQYKLVSRYRYLYQNSAKSNQPLLSDVSHSDQKDFLATQAIYECDTIIQNMDHELTGSTKRKVDDTMEKIISTQNLNHAEFYELQNTLLEHYRAKSKEATSMQKKKQLQLFIRFLEDISHSDI